MKNSYAISDYFGIASATFCVIHCIATPFLIVIVSKYEWWSSLSYLFLTISFFAVYQASKSKPPAYILTFIWAGFVGLTLSTLSEDYWTYGELTGYIFSVVLVTGHILNIRYCKKCKYA